MGLAAGLTVGDTGTEVRVLTGAGLAQVPGILVLGAAVVAAVGLVPRWATGLSWLLLVACLVLGPLFGPALGLPGWLQDLSPFTHVPNVPATSLTATPVVLLSVACIALAGVGMAAIRRRDLVLPA
jgi:ABC-2 type transport system permease protein